MPFADYFEHVWAMPLAGDAGSGAHGRSPTCSSSRASCSSRRASRSETLAEAACGAVPGPRRRPAGVRPPVAERLGPRPRAPREQEAALDGARNSPRTFGHFGRSGTFLWVDPEAGLALACLTDRAFGDWAVDAWPRLADAVLEELQQ